MVRKLILAVVILAMAAVPVPALARDGGHGGRHGFRGGHERFERHGRFEHFGHFHRPFIGFGSVLRLRAVGLFFAARVPREPALCG